jgi:citrate synthase
MFRRSAVPDGPYLSTEQVARRLGVKAETVYAYVSRGLLTSIRTDGQRGSRFSADEVDRLAGRGRDQRASGVVERIRTGLTLLDHDSLYYRGRNAVELAVDSSVETVASWLWTSDFGVQEPFPTRATTVTLPGNARSVDRIRLIVATLAALDPLRFDLSLPALVNTARWLIGSTVAALPSLEPTKPRHDDLASALWPKLTRHPAHPACVAILRAALILLADHDLAVSTLAVRVAASSRANLYAALSAGLGAFDGQLHGTASTPAYRLLSEAIKDPIAAVSEQMRTGSPLPGFGHRVYVSRDPRAELLLQLLSSVRHRAAGQVCTAVNDIRAITTDTFPNVDLALAAMAHAFDMRPDAGETMFAVARFIGWTAHAIEEYAEPPLRFRPIGVYIGPAPQD